MKLKSAVLPGQQQTLTGEKLTELFSNSSNITNSTYCLLTAKQEKWALWCFSHFWPSHSFLWVWFGAIHYSKQRLPWGTEHKESLSEVSSVNIRTWDCWVWRANATSVLCYKFSATQLQCSKYSAMYVSKLQFSPTFLFMTTTATNDQQSQFFYSGKFFSHNLEKEIHAGKIFFFFFTEWEKKLEFASFLKLARDSKNHSKTFFLFPVPFRKWIEALFWLKAHSFAPVSREVYLVKHFARLNPLFFLLKY